MPKKKSELPKSEDTPPEIDLKPEDIFLEIDLRTLTRMDSNLAHSEDDMVGALSKVRWTRKWIHKIMKNDADKVMKRNEERITALEENMKSSIEALQKVEKKADIYKAGFEESQRLLADKEKEDEG